MNLNKNIVYVVFAITPCSSFLGGVFTDRNIAIDVCNQIFKEQQKMFFYSNYQVSKIDNIDEYSLYEQDEFEQSLSVSVDTLKLNQKMNNLF